MTDDIEKRLADIEARVAGHRDTYPWSARYSETAELFGEAPADLAWLVALVRRYRAALVRIAPPDGLWTVVNMMPPDREPLHVCSTCHARVSVLDPETKHEDYCAWLIAREALNEDVTL